MIPGMTGAVASGTKLGSASDTGPLGSAADCGLLVSLVRPDWSISNFENYR